ncbi:MAG TPA: helix-turn-helix domain-containing protein [Acidimicrobiales bacterium]|nr:helix-turn-helix domain-containing protein [Acidimicrobiales bacterium]
MPVHVSDIAGERLSYSPGEAAAVLGVSRGTVYKLLDAGALASCKLGSRRLIRRSDLEAFLDALPAEVNGGFPAESA